MPLDLLEITDSNLKNLIIDVSEHWQPKGTVSTEDWIPENIRLPEGDGGASGRYQLDSVPYFWGIMHALDNKKVWLVVVQKAAQIGWTVLLAAWICKLMRLEPSRILALFPKEEKARDFLEEKLLPMVESSPAISSYFDFAKSNRRNGNRSTRKKFPGGELKCVGSNSVSNVKSTTARIGIVEEPDDTNKDVGDQGDSIRLFRERLKRVLDKCLAIGGTPSIDGLSQVQHYTSMGTIRILPIECHDCGKSHPLDWVNVSWLQKQGGTEHPVFGYHLPETAVYSCPHCGSVWSDFQRKQNILNTCKRAKAAGDDFAGWVKTQCAEDYGPDEAEPIETFKDLSELYVRIEGTSLSDVVRDYLEAEHEASLGDEAARIVFQNAKLGIPYKYSGEGDLDHEELEKLAEDYEELCVPYGGLVVTFGVDVQHDRLAVVIRANGRNEESWLIFWGELYAETTCADKNDPVWSDLDNLVFQGFKHESGGTLYARAGTIDSSDGQTNDAVYHWVRTRQPKHPKTQLMAGKGSSSQTDPEIFVTPRQKSVDHNNPKEPTKADKYGVKVYIIGTNKAKDLIQRRLSGTSAFMHVFKTTREDYWKQVTAEIKAPSKKLKGKKTWQKRSGRRNEALDCEVYALHAARSLKVHLMQPGAWDALEKRLRQTDLFNQPAKPATETVKPSQRKSSGRMISKGVEV